MDTLVSLDDALEMLGFYPGVSRVSLMLCVEMQDICLLINPICRPLVLRKNEYVTGYNLKKILELKQLREEIYMGLSYKALKVVRGILPQPIVEEMEQISPLAQKNVTIFRCCAVIYQGKKAIQFNETYCCDNILVSSSRMDGRVHMVSERRKERVQFEYPNVMIYL